MSTCRPLGPDAPLGTVTRTPRPPLKVYCNFFMYRIGAETDRGFYVGSREDVLRKEDGAWKIAYRKVVLDQNALLAKNNSNFL